MPLSTADRAVYHFVESGGCDATHAALYRRELAHLARAGLVIRRSDGGYDAISPSTPPVANNQSEPPLSEPLVSVVARLPQAWVDTLDAIGPNRSDAIRNLLGRALASESGARIKTH